MMSNFLTFFMTSQTTQENSSLFKETNLNRCSPHITKMHLSRASILRTLEPGSLSA